MRDTSLIASYTTLAGASIVIVTLTGSLKDMKEVCHARRASPSSLPTPREDLSMNRFLPWRESDREILLNRVRRKALEVKPIADAYWRRQERRAPLRARLARRALARRRVQEAFWRYQDLRVNPRSKSRRG